MSRRNVVHDGNDSDEEAPIPEADSSDTNSNTNTPTRLRLRSVSRSTTPTSVPANDNDDNPIATNNNNNNNSLTYNDLLNRPRSNPRSRTPMRFESPLNANAFRRDLHSNYLREDEVQQQQRPVILMAGAPTGSMNRSRTTTTTTAPHHSFARRNTNGTSTPSVSSKQGLGRRKANRWKNESWTGLAYEFANTRAATNHGSSKNSRSKSSAGTEKARSSEQRIAHLFLDAQADAVQYRNHYQPLPSESRQEKSISHLLLSASNGNDDENKKEDRLDSFVKGESLSLDPTRGIICIGTNPVTLCFTPNFLWNRVHKRLQTVLVRLVAAVSKSSNQSSTITDNRIAVGPTIAIAWLERYLVRTLSSASNSDTNNDEDTCAGVENHGNGNNNTNNDNIVKDDDDDDDIDDDNWNQFDWLVCAPQPTKIRTRNHRSENDNAKRKAVQRLRFVFRKQAGLERLMLHAICQFHGLQAVSMDTTFDAETDTIRRDSTTITRCVVVSGNLQAPDIHLLDAMTIAVESEACG